MPEKLTVLIPCKNEAHNIRACIESVRNVADEILVADSLSTDNTLDIVRRSGVCRIIEREFIDYASFKNWAIPQASHSWILVVDADERVTEELERVRHQCSVSTVVSTLKTRRHERYSQVRLGLAAEIREVLARNDPSLDAYEVGRKTYFLDRPIRHSGWNRAKVVRLFRRDACRYGAARVHEQLEVRPGRLGTLRGKLLHYTCRSVSQWMEKQIRYAAIWAEDHRAAGRRTSWLGILMRPPLRFFHLYVFRGGFLDGTAGLIICLGNAFYTFLKYALLWQLNRAVATREPPAASHGS